MCDVLAPPDPSLGHLGPLQAPDASQTVDMHEKSMQPIFFIFGFYLPKKLFGDALAPPEPSLGHWAPYKPQRPPKPSICMKNRCNQDL